jgi:hypothetical protein
MLYQNPQYYKRIEIEPKRTSFMFDNLDSYNRFIAEAEQRSTGNCRQGINGLGGNYVANTASMSWFGTTNPALVQNPIDYLFNTELDNGLQTLRSRTVNVDKRDIDQQKAIKFTEKEIGVFSFDLASLGLIPVYEFYSPLLKSVVSANLVVSEINANGELLFFHIYTPEIAEHIVKYNTSKAGYYSDILQRNVDRTELIEISNVEFKYPQKQEVQKHLVVREQKVDENGNKRFTTTFKRCFIEMPKVEKPLPRIDIIVGNSFASNVNAETQMLYNSMAALALAEKLSNSGIQYRILVCYGTEASGSNARQEKVYGFVNIKKEGQIISRNNLAILLSDGRFSRFQQFKGDLALQFDAGYDRAISPGGIGRTITDAREIKDAYIKYLERSDDPSDNKAALRTDTKIVFSNSLSLQDAEREYNDTIQQLITI